MSEPSDWGPPPAEWEVQWVGMPEVFPKERVAAIAGAALDHGKRPGATLSVVFVDDPTLTRMHAEYLHDDSPTDVITFDLQDADDPVVAGPVGELYVSVDCARRIAAERGVPFERELALYVVHGALHLCGFDDHTAADRAAMREAEAAVMGGLGFAPDTKPHDS